MSNEPVPRTAIIHLPKWLWGGDPEGLLRNARLWHKRLPDGQTGWNVQVEERHVRRVRPGLIDVVDIAGPHMREALWRRISEIPDPTDLEITADTIKSAATLHSRAEASTDIVHLINWACLQLTTVRTEDLAVQSKFIVEQVQQTTVSEDGSFPFDGASMYLIRKDEALTHRTKLSQVLLRLDAGGTLEDFNREQAQGVLSFAASNGLLSGMYLMDVFVRPLLGAISPAVWGFASYRAKGAMIVGLGTSIAGTTGESAELLQMLTAGSHDAPEDNPPITSADIDSAVSWWATALDRVLSITSDPAVHCDHTGAYSARRHLEVVLTIQQLFQRVAAIQGAHRDTDTARAIFFTVVDTLSWFTGKSFDHYCNVETAKKTLAFLEQELPDAAANLLLPNARRAVAALVELQDGFFVRKSSSTSLVQLRGSDGYTEDLRPEVAVAEYVGVLRNAIHGHGAKKNADRSAALLGQHDGNIPHDLALVGYLYFIELIAQPDFLLRKLTAASRLPPRKGR